MIERATLKQMIAAAEQAAQHEEQATRKFYDLARQAEAQRDKRRAEAGALTQLLELYYPSEKADIQL